MSQLRNHKLGNRLRKQGQHERLIVHHIHSVLRAKSQEARGKRKYKNTLSFITPVQTKCSVISVVPRANFFEYELDMVTPAMWEIVLCLLF